MRYEYDAFICHASEDKEDFVRPLANALHDKGMNIWYDEFSLKVGDSLRRSIDLGLKKSKYGIVVLSPIFFKKDWPQKELDGLTALEVDGRKIILPIWHKVNKKDVMQYSPILADKIAITSYRGMKHIVTEIVRVIQPKDKYEKLISDAMRRWLTHDILPSVEELYVLWENIDPQKLNPEEIAFIYASYLSRDDELEDWSQDNDIFSFEYLVDYLAKLSNFNKPILSAYPDIKVLSWALGGLLSWDDAGHTRICRLMIYEGNNKVSGLYCYIEAPFDKATEFIILRRNDFTTLIRYIPSQTEAERKKIDDTITKLYNRANRNKNNNV
ncbi:MAG: hypothetical protein A2Y97_04585 [Nitrospirae bacterium RBG_13_39_12]|nr:MAG: hypothetical protein A2Y97_04585 [Nitrospirae bacterium RBG_13_39_12]